jgi:hypothetical protein
MHYRRSFVTTVPVPYIYICYSLPKLQLQQQQSKNVMYESVSVSCRDYGEFRVEGDSVVCLRVEQGSDGRSR